MASSRDPTPNRRRRQRRPRKGQLPLFPKRGPRPHARRRSRRVVHVARVPVDPRHPVQVTQRLGAIDCLRRPDCYRVVEAALAAGSRKAGFRMVHFSVQANHLHLICEAADRTALSRGLQGLFIRIARALNRHLGRSGKVFEDRYHDRVLRTPTEVRHALRYVLNNLRKHRNWLRRDRYFIDPLSSGPSFYTDAPRRWLPAPRCWLLASGGWRRAGTIHPGETPGGT